MENCSHPERHTSPIGLESYAEEGKSHAPARSELTALACLDFMAAISCGLRSTGSFPST